MTTDVEKHGKHSMEKQSNAWKTLKCGMKTEPRKCLPSLPLTLIFFSWNMKNFPHIVCAEKKHDTIFYNGSSFQEHLEDVKMQSFL